MSDIDLVSPVELRLQERSPAKEPEVTSTFALALSILRRNLFVFLIVGVPVFLTILYEGIIASDIYVSEAHFIVRSKAMASSMTGLSDTSSLLPLSSMSQSNDYTQAVNDYLASRDIIKLLINSDNLLEVLSRPGSDFWARFPRPWSRRTIESLYDRFDDFVYPYLDPQTGISTLQVYAFQPEDAQRIARSALEHAEALINKLNARQQKDSVAFAQDMLDKAQAKVWEVEQRITDFRNRERIFDPERQGAATIGLIGTLIGQITQLKAELSEVNINSPGSPKIASIKARIGAIEDQIAEQRAQLVGGEQSLAPKLAVYEKLMLERDMAVKVFGSSLISLESAIKDMDMQRLYLERVVEPNLPDYPLYPRHFLVVLIVSGFSLCIYWVLKVVGEVTLEHES